MKISQKGGGIALNYSMLASNVLVKFLYTPFLLKELGASEYGLYTLVFTIVGYVSILDLGFGSALTRYIVKYKTEKSRKELLDLYGTATGVYLVVGIIALVVCSLIGFFSGAIFGDSLNTVEINKLRIMLVICGLNLLFCFPLQIATSVLVANEEFIFKNFLSLVRVLLEPVVMIVLLYAVHIKSLGVVIVITSFNIILYFSYYLFAKHKLGFVFALTNFKRNLIPPLLSFSFGMFMLTIYEQLQFHSGQFVLAAYEGTVAVAIWGVSMLFVYNFRLVSTTISNVYLPSFIESVTSKSAQNGILPIIKEMTNLQFLVLSVTFLNFFLFGKEFLLLWAGEEYVDVYNISLIMITPMFLGLLLEFCYMWQIATGKLSYRIYTLFISFIFSFCFVYLIWGINLVSFSYIVSLSYFSGQVLFVIVYIKRYVSINFLNLFLYLLNRYKFLLLFMCVLIIAKLSFQYKELSLLSFVLSVVFVNLIIGIIVLTKHKQIMIKKLSNK